MFTYEKPIGITAEEVAEGVYMASDATGTDRPGGNGCPAFRYNGCGLQLDYVDSNFAASYDQDNGKRMPGWEVKGHKPDETINLETYDM